MNFRRPSSASTVSIPPSPLSNPASSVSSLASSVPSTITASSIEEQHEDTGEGNYLKGLTKEQGEEHAPETSTDADVLVTGTPMSQKLGRFSLVCLLVDKKIGTGVYSTASFILKHTGSPGAALLTYLFSWAIQAIGLCMYLENAMAIPRYFFHEVVRGSIHTFSLPIPRSGADKNYLEHFFPYPQYLMQCLYAAGFVVFGSTAGNAIVAAQHLLIVGDCDPDKFKAQKGYAWKVKGIAIALITIVCIFHSAWRKGGIYLNNTLAIIKISALIFVTCSGLWWHSQNPDKRPNTFGVGEAFKRTEYAKSRSSMQAAGDFAYALMFSFYSSSGFEATNMILSEVKNIHTRTKFTPKYTTTVLIVYGFMCFLFTLCFMSFFLVLPADAIAKHTTTVVSNYIETIYGSSGKRILLSSATTSSCNACSAGLSTAQRAMSFLLAISAFGNVVIVTYLNSRVKQEIAKDGILPFSRWLSSEMRNTPVPALALHWAFSCITIAAVPDPLDGYSLLVFWCIFFRYVILGGLLAATMVAIYCNREKAREWTRYNTQLKTFRLRGGKYLYTIYAITMFILFILSWLPTPRSVPNDDDDDDNISSSSSSSSSLPSTCPTLPKNQIPWFIYPVITTVVLAGGAVYWVGFSKILPRVWHRELSVSCVTVVDTVERVQVREVRRFEWVIPGDRVEGEKGEERW